MSSEALIKTSQDKSHEGTRQGLPEGQSPPPLRASTSASPQASASSRAVQQPATAEEPGQGRSGYPAGQGREARRAADRSVLTLHSSRPPRAAPLAAASHWPPLGGVGQWAAAAAGRWQRAAETVNGRRRGRGGWLSAPAGRASDPGAAGTLWLPRTPGSFGPFRLTGWRGVKRLRAPGAQAGTSAARVAAAPLLQGCTLPWHRSLNRLPLIVP